MFQSFPLPLHHNLNFLIKNNMKRAKLKITKSNFSGDKYLLSAIGDSIICFYGGSNSNRLPNYIYFNFHFYRYNTSYTDLYDDSVIICYNSTSVCFDDICRLSSDLNAPIHIEEIR